MSNYQFIKAAASELADMKRQHLEQLTAPLDDMWAYFIAAADHYSIIIGNKTIGYCAVNSEQKLLQFYAIGAYDLHPVFGELLSQLSVTGAVVATSDSQLLSLCMDHQKSVAVNTLMYHMDKKTPIEEPAFPMGAQFKAVKTEDFAIAVDFAVDTLAVDRNWLEGYFSDLIKDEKLFGLWQGGALIATGECRASDMQKPYANVGMVVSKNHRRQAIATNILRRLIHLCNEKGLKPICSTEAGNIGAQKAIVKAGFSSHHRILDIIF